MEVCQVRKQLRSLDGKKSTGKDQIPPKLVLLAADGLALPLTNAINSTISNNKFPKNGKHAALCPLDKGQADRSFERNFRPIGSGEAREHTCHVTTDISNSYFEHFYFGCAMTIVLRMRRKFNEFCMTNFLELASPLPVSILKKF